MVLIRNRWLTLPNVPFIQLFWYWQPTVGRANWGFIVVPLRLGTRLMKRCFTIELLFSISMREGRVPSPGRTLMKLVPVVRAGRVQPGRRETTTANLTSTLTTSATKSQHKNPYVPAIHLSASLLCYILATISIRSTCVFASPMCSLIFQFLPVPPSMPGHVSTNGCLESWQCN